MNSWTAVSAYEVECALQAPYGSRTEAPLPAGVLLETMGRARWAPLRVQSPAQSSQTPQNVSRRDGLRARAVHIRRSFAIGCGLSRATILTSRGRRSILCFVPLLRDFVDFDAKIQSAWSRFIMGLLHRNPEAIARLKQRTSEYVVC
jgi:hypothetical protein